MDTQPDGHKLTDHSGLLLDPRAVLFAFVSLAIWVGMSRTLAGSGLLAVGALLLAWRLRRVDQPSFAMPGSLLRWSLPMAILITILYAFLETGDAHGVAIVNGLKLSWSGVAAGACLGLRFLAFIGLAGAMTALTTPAGLAAGLTRLLWPLRSIGVKVEAVYYLVFFISRMLPTLSEELHTIRMGQRSRGVRFDGSWFQRIRTSPALLVPAFAASIRRADRLSIALTSRGFDVHHLPSDVRRLRFRHWDWMLSGTTASGWLIWLALERLGHGSWIS